MSLPTLTVRCSADHGLRTAAGYIVRRTYFDGREHVDAGAFGPFEYSLALQRAREVRAEQAHWGYAVIDTVYSCGCRGQG